MTNTVLILGARGRFGLATARAFADAGWHVLGLIRPGAQLPSDAAGERRISWVSADLDDTAAVVRAGHGASVVVHALNPAYTDQAWRAQALPMTDAAIRITRALNATLMFPGNVYNFGAEMPAVLAEDTPQHASTVMGQIRISMEQRIRDSGVAGIVIRAGDFFGSGKGGWFDQAIAKDIRQGKLTYPGHKDVTRPWAYLPDLANTFAQVAARRDSLARFEVFHFAGHNITGQQWLDAIEPIAHATGWITPGARVAYSRLPWAIIRLGALFLPTWAALWDMRYLWNIDHALNQRKLVALLGAAPHTPLAQALATTFTGMGFIKTIAGTQSA